MKKMKKRRRKKGKRKKDDNIKETEAMNQFNKEKEERERKKEKVREAESYQSTLTKQSNMHSFSLFRLDRKKTDSFVPFLVFTLSSSIMVCSPLVMYACL